ncbi:MAG: ATP synthase F1 subunit epsilon [Oscillospiraceae bacterium]|nr:ATP synthase F1 subunit epsilon [Oscillospiraceae bacterium]MCI7498301.1 ATP synthase F1 subunit epsilon [Oscillospiraceae bacterium]MDD7278876.1 ATP synthase F1 subunit epsilon [Oscillospiraceae bacterium]MDY2863919.1 ATP synthase F1 subunit epsilon [Oscillospiraceae bacterium]
MATPFQLTVITPEKTFFDGETTQIIVRTTEGDIGILANHTSLVASLPSGPLKVMQDNGEYRLAAVSAGLIKVGGNKVHIFADAVEWADEIDIEWAKRSEENARQRIAAKASQRDFDLAELKLKRALNRINVHNSLLK